MVAMTLVGNGSGMISESAPTTGIAKVSIEAVDDVEGSGTVTVIAPSFDGVPGAGTNMVNVPGPGAVIVRAGSTALAGLAIVR